MLKSLSIRNFRIHKKLRIKFSPHVTTIVGKSYAGKSTVINALKWTCLNRPSGISVIQWGSKQTAVTLNIDEFGITRTRSKSKNQYRLKRREKEDKFVAFGNGVPSKISSILNVTENNFQGQHSLPFWFGETSGEVSRQLNGIVNLGVIDSTTSNINSMQRKAKVAAEICEERVKKTREEYKGLEFVIEMEKDWEKITTIKKQLDRLIRRLEKLQDELDDYREFEKTIQQAKPPSIEPLTVLYEELNEVEDECVKIEIMLDRIKSKQAEVTRLEKETDRLQKKLDEMQKGRCPLCGKMQKP